MCMNSLFSSDSSQCTIIHPTLILIKTLWFIHINTVFSPHIYCIRSYSKHLYENKGYVSHDMSIMFRDQTIMGFPQVPILQWLQFIYRSNRSFNIPPSPRATPRVFDFLENYCSNPPYPNQNAVQMLHTRVHSGDQMPPSRGDLKTFHIIHYVGALKAESAYTLQ